MRFEITHHVLKPDGADQAEVLRTAPSNDTGWPDLSTSATAADWMPPWMTRHRQRARQQHARAARWLIWPRYRTEFSSLWDHRKAELCRNDASRPARPQLRV